MQTKSGDRGLKQPINYKKEFKNIRILSYGRIGVLHGINGPVLQQFKCNIDTIMHLVNTKVNVVEVLEDGSEVTLNKYNYYKNNNKVVEHIEQVKPQEVSTPEEKKIETIESNDSQDTSVEEETTESNDNRNFNKNNKNKNFNNNNTRQKNK